MTNLEGRVVRRRKAVAPPPGVRTDIEILCALARGAGPRRRVRTSTDAREVFDELRRATRRRARRLLGHHATSASTREGGVFWPCPSEDHPGTPRLFARALPDAERPRAVPRGAPTRAPRSARRRLPPVPHHGPRPRALPVGHADAARGEPRRAGPGRHGRDPPAARSTARPGRRRHGAPRDAPRRGELPRASSTPDIRPDTVFVPFHWGGLAVGQPADEPGARSRSAGCRSSRSARRASRARQPAAAKDARVRMKERLVVIGNGMAGARLVEDVLAAGRRATLRDRGVRRRALRQLQPHPAVLGARRQPRPQGHLHQPPRLVRRERRPPARRRAGAGGSTARARTVHGRRRRRPTTHEAYDHAGDRDRQRALRAPRWRAWSRRRTAVQARRVRLPHARRLRRHHGVRRRTHGRPR